MKLRWMCGLTEQTTEVVRPCDADEIGGADCETNANRGQIWEEKKRAAKPKVENACKRDMTEAGLKKDNTTNRAA